MSLASCALSPHKPDTIYDWLDRYEQQGIEGLKI
jgi:Helix-turn-helix domain